jgi:hypothetical protein
MYAWSTKSGKVLGEDIIVVVTHLSSVGEECRLLVVELNSLGVKVYGTGIISRLKGLVALILEFDSHFAKSAFYSAKK